MAPTPGKNKLFKRFAAALRHLPFPQRFWQRFCITWISERNHAYRLPSFRNVKTFPCSICAKTTHLMRGESQGRGLEDEICRALSQVVKTVPIWLVVFFETRVRDRKDEHRRISRPCSIRVHKDSGQRFIVFRIVPRGHEVCPGLLIS